jgi:hypothetical protein
LHQALGQLNYCRLTFIPEECGPTTPHSLLVVVVFVAPMFLPGGAVLLIVGTACTRVWAFLPARTTTTTTTNTACRSPKFPSLQRVELAVKPSGGAKTPEYSTWEEEEEENAETTTTRQNAVERSAELESQSIPTPPSDAAVPSNYRRSKGDSRKDDSNKATDTAAVVQYAALPPGTVVQIQVGDVGLARKAWKKRRRSGSPLLLPCSVLNVDRASTVRWNLIYLLEKFGRPSATAAAGGTKGGVQLSLPQLTKRYRSHLKTSLAKQASALGFEDVPSLVRALFNERVQKSYGIDLLVGEGEENDGEVTLQAPVSRLRAQKRANRSPVLQVADDLCEDTLKHTGVVRTRRSEKSTDKEESTNLYQLQPLSAALRVNQREDVEVGNIQTGSMHTAVVFDYDATGDAGAPLITLTLNSSPRDRLKFVSDASQKDIIHHPKYMLHDLSFGDGPMKGKVVRFIKGGALVDCGIGRRAGASPDAKAIRVLGVLKFTEAFVEDSMSELNDDTDSFESDDSMEDWDEILSLDDLIESDLDESANADSDMDLSGLLEFDDVEEDEEVEDITHMFTTEADGSLTYTDPDTGVVEHISAESLADDENEDVVDVFDALNYGEEGDDDDEEDGPVLLSEPAKGTFERTRDSPVRSKRLHIGDEIKVYVRSIAKQSNQIFFTMRSSVSQKKPKEIKAESNKDKKLNRLLKQVGGMRRIRELEGREMDGIVRAISHAGDWLYVEPQEESLPVGVAFGDKSAIEGISQGDGVRIRLEGIDEARGQLALRFLDRLSP